MTEPKPLTPLCSAVSDAELEDGMYKGLDVKEYCDMLPDCYVTESEEGWACESAMDICRAIEGEESLQSFPAAGLRPVATWVLDEAAASKLSATYKA